MLPLDFTWTAPDACPTRAEVVEQLSKAVDFGGKELPPLTARAVVAQDGPQWRLELETEMDGRHGTRLLEADSCEGLARAATLVLALTLGEGLARREAADDARADEPPPAPPAPPPPSPPPTEARHTFAPPSPRIARTLAWAGVGIASDPLGALAPAASFSVGFEPGSYRVALSLDATLPRQSAIGGSVHVRGFSFGGGLAACFVAKTPPLRLAACVEVGLTWLDARGRGSEDDRHALIPLYGVGPRLSLEWPLTGASFLSLDVGSRLFSRRPELIVAGAAERRRVELGSVRVALGAGVRW